jgi:hypothetical protein
MFSSVSSVISPSIIIAWKIHVNNVCQLQKIWKQIVVVSDDIARTKKALLSRSSRYSGLNDVLDFRTLVAIDEDQSLKDALSDAQGWLALNVSATKLDSWGALALSLSIKRVIFTTQLTPLQLQSNQTELPVFRSLKSKFEESGLWFTGIRHGTVKTHPGDSSYFISNSTTPCLTDSIPQSVFSRIVTELLPLDISFNKECGISAANEFAGEYLRLLRSAGLSTQEEVFKVFTGGIERAASSLLLSNQQSGENNDDDDDVDEWKSLSRRQLEEESQDVDDHFETMKETQRQSSQLFHLEDEIYEADEFESYQDDNDDSEIFSLETSESNYRSICDKLIELKNTSEEYIANRTSSLLRSEWKNFQDSCSAVDISEADFFSRNLEQTKRLAVIEYKSLMERMEQNKVGLVGCLLASG